MKRLFVFVATVAADVLAVAVDSTRIDVEDALIQGYGYVNEESGLSFVLEDGWGYFQDSACFRFCDGPPGKGFCSSMVSYYFDWTRSSVSSLDVTYRNRDSCWTVPLRLDYRGGKRDVWLIRYVTPLRMKISNGSGDEWELVKQDPLPDLYPKKVSACYPADKDSSGVYLTVANRGGPAAATGVRVVFPENTMELRIDSIGSLSEKEIRVVTLNTDTLMTAAISVSLTTAEYSTANNDTTYQWPAEVPAKVKTSPVRSAAPMVCGSEPVLYDIRGRRVNDGSLSRGIYFSSGKSLVLMEGPGRFGGSVRRRAGEGK